MQSDTHSNRQTVLLASKTCQQGSDEEKSFITLIQDWLVHPQFRCIPRPRCRRFFKWVYVL